MRAKGTITSWNDDKGYGFVTPRNGGNRIFIHISALANRARRPVLNDVVTYSVSRDEQGRPCAANATLGGDKLTKRSPKKSRKTLIFLAAIFVAATGASAINGYLPVALFVGYVTLSVITLVAYALDKSAARRGAWRTSESTLLLLGLAGGWPGALVAQETLRHKSRKSSFRAAFWITVVINCAVLAWLHTANGQAALFGLLAEFRGQFTF